MRIESLIVAPADDPAKGWAARAVVHCGGKDHVKTANGYPTPEEAARAAVAVAGREILDDLIKSIKVTVSTTVEF